MTEPIGQEGGEVVALVLGAGRGERLGHALPKAFVPLAGQSLLERSMRSLLASDGISRLIPVLASEDVERFRASGLAGLPSVEDPVVGGAERQDSVRAGLAAVATRANADRVRWVVVHDAARCLVAPQDVTRVVSEARASGAAILGQPSTDTIKLVGEDRRIRETPARADCWAAQTPQVARRDWLEEATAAAASSGRLGTDDAQLLEWAGFPVRMVEARSPNPKITRPEDLIAAEALLGLGEAPAPARGSSGQGTPDEAAASIRLEATR